MDYVEWASINLRRSGHGAVDWDGVFRFTAQTGFSEAVTMETAPWDQGANYSVETWQSTVRELEEWVNHALE